MEIREGAYYRSRIGYVQGPLRRSGSTAMPWTCNGWSWDAKGRFATDERMDSYDLVVEVYVRDTPLAERDALRAENEKLRETLRILAEECEADYPPSHGAIKYAARAALGEKG
jgi:hypothetical protein